MLILTRNIGESLKIGDEITITILNTQNNQTKIGIDAPKHVAVDREEIYHRKQNNVLPQTSNQNQTPPEVRNPKQSYTQPRTVHDATDRHANFQPKSNPNPEHYNDAPQLTGNILFIKKFAGYGFIYAPGHDSNIYFHATDVLNNQFYQLEEGSDVNFCLVEGPRGLNAKQVEMTNWNSTPCTVISNGAQQNGHLRDSVYDQTNQILRGKYQSLC